MEIEQVYFKNSVDIANIEASKRATMLDADLAIGLQKKRAALLQEQHRAELLSCAIVEAEEIKTTSDGAFYKRKQDADAKLYAASKRADAIRKLFEAQAKGIIEMQKSFHGDNEAIIKYLMLERGVYKKIADQNADALRGLKPRIAVMTNGSATSTYTGK